MWRHDIGSPLDRLQIDDAQPEAQIVQSLLGVLGGGSFDQVASNTRTLCQEAKLQAVTNRTQTTINIDLIHHCILADGTAGAEVCPEPDYLMPSTRSL